MTGRAFLRSKTEAEADERRGASAGPRQAELDGVGRNICGANNRPRGFAERNGGRFKADKRREGAKAPF